MDAPLNIEQLDNLQKRQRTAPLLAEIPLWLVRHMTSQESRRGPKIPNYSDYTPPCHGYMRGGVSVWNQDKHCWETRDSVGASGAANQPWGGRADSWAMENARRAQERRNNRMAARHTVEEGNLGEADYRFWEGSRTGPIVRCRWCGLRCDDKDKRMTHFKKDSDCSKLLRIVFDNSMKHATRWCFSCGQITLQSRWGIPLCNTEKCIAGWKFDAYSSHEEFDRRVKIERAVGHLAGYEDNENSEN